MARQVKIEILGDARGLRRAFGEAERSTTGLAKGIARAGVFAATGLAGIATGIGVAAFKSIQAAQESNKVSKQTEAVIKSTGGAAHVTTKQIGDLATAISNKTGIDDEQVQSSENMLLTFTNVRNEVGRGNDIFNQATSILQDMSVALGVDSSKSAIQLGKALNDPIKGVTALSRVGVTFTAQQKEQIKTLVDSGKRMEAQKIILRELTKEFGGSAAAASTPLDRLKVTVGNLQEQIGNKLLPVVNQFANWVDARVVPAASRLADRLGGYVNPAVRGFKDGIAIVQKFVKNDLVPQLGRLKTAWDDNKQAITTLLNPVDSLGTKMGTGKDRAGSLVDALVAVVTAAGQLSHALNVAGNWLNNTTKWLDRVATTIHEHIRPGLLALEVVVLDVANGFLFFVQHTLGLFNKGIRDSASSARKTIGNMRDGINAELHAINNRVDVNVVAHDHVTRVVSRIMREMRSQGFSVTARLVRGGTFAKGGKIPGYGGGDTVPAMLEPGEAIVPKHLVPEMAPWAGMRGIPGFQRGGRVWPANVNLEASRAALMDRATFSVSGSVDAIAKRTATLLGRLWEWAAWARRIRFESGGNWAAVNRSDSNWFAGHPSVGGAQVIRGTFARWAGPFRNTGPFMYGVSINPLANSFAGANYAVHRYGSLTAVDPLLRPRGYDNGGYLPPGLSVAYNGTGRPEPVGAAGLTVNVTVGQIIGSDLRRASQDLLTGIRDDLRRRGKPAVANML